MIALARRLDAILMAVLNAIVMITSVLIASLILFLVLARYVLGWSVVGVLELATLSAIWLYMSGAVVAARARAFSRGFPSFLYHGPPLESAT